MKEEKKESRCKDIECPTHGHLKLRGRTFRGKVIRKFLKRITIEFERTIFIRKYERYMRKKTRVHARLPECMKDEIKIGDYVEVKECRPLSKIIHFGVVKKIRDGSESKEKEK